ncbi:2791_t:CDS:2, partial [Rhizophagus irregularis]
KKLQRIKAAKDLFNKKDSRIMSYEKWDLLKILANRAYHSLEVSETEDKVPPDDASDWSYIDQPDMVYDTEYTDDLNIDDEDFDAILEDKADKSED